MLVLVLSFEFLLLLLCCSNSEKWGLAQEVDLHLNDITTDDTFVAIKSSHTVGSPMKKSDFHRSNRTPIQCMQAIDLYVKTTKRAMLILSFLAEK